MTISEAQFGIIFHMKEAVKFDKFYLIFRCIFIWSPALVLLWFIFPNFWIFPFIGLIALVSWVASVKMKSLRNINHYAVKEFKSQYVDEMNKTFK
jgi:glucan phosphoethanolaminetransferase (alkaline phosphatase superfamily)